MTGTVRKYFYWYVLVYYRIEVRQQLLQDERKRPSTAYLIDSEARETGVTSSRFLGLVDRSFLNVKVDEIVLVEIQDDRIGSRLIDSITPSVDDFVIVFHQSDPSSKEFPLVP